MRTKSRGVRAAGAVLMVLAAFGLCASTSQASGGSAAASQAAGQGAGGGRNVIIFVADGLRPGSVTPTEAPTLYKIRHEGVDFTNSHALFPTFTTANASTLATGHYLGDTGDFSNTIYSGFPVPSADGSIAPFIESDPILADLNDHYSGNYLNEESLLAAARKAGYSTASVGKLGPTLIQDVTQGNKQNGKVPPPSTYIMDDSTGTEDGVPLNPTFKEALKTAGLPTKAPERGDNGEAGSFSTTGTKVPNTDQQKYFADATTKAILPTFQKKGKPFAMVYWSRDPDGTQHNQGDSLNSLTPGINGPTSKAAVKNADDNLKQILDTLKAKGLANNTDVFVTSDHGFGTISRSAIDASGDTTKSYSATLDYPEVKKGFLPPGFLAIGLAHDLNLPLYDPNEASKKLDDKSNVTYHKMDPTKGQYPEYGAALIGGAGKVTSGKTDAKVVVAANGGSDLIYLPNGDPALAQQVVKSLAGQDYVSGLFVDEKKFGSIPGALPISAIGLEGSAATPTPAIAVNFRSFATDPTNPENTGVEISDTNLQQGQGMHGTLGRHDTFNNMAAIGPDFKSGFVDDSPVGNSDVQLTLANILGLKIPAVGNLQGRVLNEALVGGPESVASEQDVLASKPAANGVQTTLQYQQVGGTRYFDAAGFAGRSVGLTTMPESGGLSPLLVPMAGGAFFTCGVLGLLGLRRYRKRRAVEAR